MTNTKFRKRALLSSVAMLLVALVALGSATFAWFVDDPTANAKGISAQAQASTGLLISSDTSGLDNYAKSVDLGKSSGSALGITLAPAITKDDGAFWSVQADNANSPAAKSGEKWTTVQVKKHEAISGGVYKEQINLKRTGGLTGTLKHAVYLHNVNLQLNSSAKMKQALTILLTDTSNNPIAVINNGTVSAVKKLKSTADPTVAGGLTYSSSDIESYAAAKHVTAKTADNAELGTAGAVTGKIKIGDFDKDTDVISLYAYVFLDGEDSTVYTNNATAAEDIISSVNFYFALASRYGVDPA